MRKLTRSDNDAKYYVSNLTLMLKYQFLCIYAEVNSIDDAYTDADPCIEDDSYNDIYAKNSRILMRVRYFD